jgi:hypothetical protein
MKTFKFIPFLLTACIVSCHQGVDKTQSISKTDSVKVETTVVITNDKEEIQTLIRNIIKWGESKNGLELLPALPDSKDSLYTGFDFKQLDKNLQILKASNYFSADFIENYRQIITTLDRKLKNNEFGAWPVGDLPVFGFANDVDPWTLCQDVPYDNPDPFDFIEVEVIKLDDKKGELYWKWGRLEPNTHPSWKAFTYKFNVEKENGKWKIAYLQGFDYNEGIK